MWIPLLWRTTNSSFGTDQGLQHRSPIGWPNCTFKPKFFKVLPSKYLPFHSIPVTYISMALPQVDCLPSCDATEGLYDDWPHILGNTSRPLGSHHSGSKLGVPCRPGRGQRRHTYPLAWVTLIRSLRDLTLPSWEAGSPSQRISMNLSNQHISNLPTLLIVWVPCAKHRGLPQVAICHRI